MYPVIPLRAFFYSRQILRTGLHCDTAIVLLFNLERVTNSCFLEVLMSPTYFFCGLCWYIPNPLFKNIFHHSVVRRFRKLPKPTLPLHFSPMH